MPVEVKVIEDRIPEIIINVEAHARAGVKRVADRIAATARSLVAYDTGALHDTIHSTSVAIGHEAQVIAGDEEEGVDYAGYQEYGTYKMAAHPFMGPAFDAHAAELPAEIRLGFEI